MILAGDEGGVTVKVGWEGGEGRRGGRAGGGSWRREGGAGGRESVSDDL